MKVIVIGGTGAIGKAVVEQLATRDEVVVVGTRSGQYQADFGDIAQVRTLFDRIGKADAVVVAAGAVAFAPLAEFTPEQMRVGLDSKLMGQVNVALVAQHALNDGGSITLTSGVVSHHPIMQGASAAMVNSAVEGFVRGAAIELRRGIRINAVNPTLLRESQDAYGDYFPGFEPVSAMRVALAYVRSVRGGQTGQVFRVW